MGNTIKDLSDGDLVREYLDSFHNKLKFLKTINKQYDNRFASTGAKNGGELLIKLPNEFTVRTGAVMDTQDVTERTITFTLSTQKGIDVNFSSIEHTMYIEDFKAMIIDPAMSKLAAMVEYDVLSNVYQDVWNMTGASGMATTPASLSCILNANARLSQGLAPTNDRHLLMDSLAMAGTVSSMGTYFHKASELERAFSEGYIGEAAGLKWWESNMVPNHTNGTRTDTTPVVNTSTGITSGTAVITMTAFADGTTYKKGDVFTVEGVYAVNPETKQRYSHLQQFVVTADETETGSGDMSPAVSPTPYTSGANQNVEIVSAGAGKLVINLTAGGSGAASGVYPQNLAYHRDAFSFVTADLYTDPGARMSRAVIEGVSMRLWRGNDIVNDKFPMRIDVLYGYKTLRPEWAVRVRG